LEEIAQSEAYGGAQSRSETLVDATGDNKKD
jgi:hypothetical protein